MSEIQFYEKRKHDPDKALNFPGEYELESAEVAGEDFLAKVGSIVIFEDMNLPYVTGEINAIDTQNMASLKPFIGGEKVKFTIRDCYRQKLEFDFVLIRVSDRRPISLSSTAYTIKFASKSYINSKAKKISKAYAKMKTEAAFADVCMNYMNIPAEKLQWVETEAPISCIIPNWRPGHSVKWLASRSVASRAEFAKSPYTVFEEKDGKMNFLPLDFLYNEETNIERGEILLKFGRHTMDDNASIALHERMGVHQLSMERFEIVKTTDFGENLEHGMYNNAVQEIDLFARDTEIREYSYKEDFEDSQHLNKYPFLRPNGIEAQNDMSYWQTVPKNDALFSDMDSRAMINPSLYSFISKWQQTEQMVVRGLLPGSFELRVGQKYRLNIPAFSSATVTGVQSIDGYFSGNYIVEAIKHEFTPNNKYFATVQLFTDSVSQEIKPILEVEGRTG
ncbi:hypothetical protein Ab1vBOLIVR5_gp213 [Agrobacterium phage OLIVR5]|uniref:Uncharacterized protein n=1 Tax=Agrobacterium phage OLIVR5 TaxID=2723773 RepID=A0A858MTW1_9CAUD|nr:tail protein [Agrobacterium phage OLIVR5]QIW87861.1 hypothetical protein Ab1vBOLIVR5_gp213 [Agrobacterium phage OLIVR5]QIW88126.1 hypothetical protein Ab1vBOLIVR6_gp219 [Agrobacterium phage OLIVR6]